MGSPAKHSVDFKTRVVLGVLRGEMSAAEGRWAPRCLETSIGKWKDSFIRAGHEGLAAKADGRASSEDARVGA